MSKYLDYVESKKEENDWSELSEINVKAKEGARLMIAEDVKRFLAYGGKIEQIPPGVCTNPVYSDWERSDD